MCERLRCERGVALIELVIASGLLLVVLVPMLIMLTAAQNHEMTVERLNRSVNDGRIALERVVKEVRHAVSIEQVSPERVDLVVDRSGSPEVVSYEISGGTRALERRTPAGSETLVGGLDPATSSLEVTPVGGGDLLTVVLTIDLDPDKPPGSTVLRTEVLARNG